MGIWRTAGDPAAKEEGTGEPNRAVDCARPSLSAAVELRLESLDEEGTALGCERPDWSPAIAISHRELRR